MTESNADLNVFFFPSSIAVVGASETLNSFGTRYIQALLNFGYKGKLYAVNLSGKEVLGLKIYRNVLDIPDSVDVAVISVAARFVPGVLEDCLKKNIKAAIILSAGFSEAGPEGQLLEAELVKIAARGIRIMGPNCFGTYCPSGGMTVIPGSRFPGDSGSAALMAQSGQLIEGIVVRAAGEGIRFSKVISYGNACDINEAELLDYLTRDEQTKIITLYLEGVRDGRRFFKIVRRNATKKPLILWKVGLTRLGAAAATSHTASLAGGSAAWDTFFRQSRAIKVGSLEELIDTTVGFSCLPSGCGPRIALISGGGAGAVVSADACETAGLTMPPFPAEIEAQLRAVMPPAGAITQNPLDIGSPFPPLQMLKSVLDAMASSDQIDVIVIRRIHFSIKLSKFFGGVAAPSYEEQQELLEIPLSIKEKYGKPVVIILTDDLTGVDEVEMEEERRKIRDYYFAHGIPVYATENRAFTAIAHLAQYRESQGKQYDNEICPVLRKTSSALAKITKTAASTFLNEIQSKEILKEAGIDVIETVLAKSRENAVAIGEKLGFPVALKVVSSQIIHKSDVGGVRLGLKTPLQVGRAYDAMMKSVRKKVPGAAIKGVSVQGMAPPGVELVIGMTKDPQFGPMLMFGLGGIFVEVLNDVAFRMAPLTVADAREMIREIKGYRLLEGYRGQAPVAVSYLEELLLRVSGLVIMNPEIKEIDINPLVAYSDGAIAVDARIILE